MLSTIRADYIVEPNFGENAYVVWARKKGPCWIIDPGLPPSAEHVLEFIRRHELTPEAILLTHGHMDHIAGIPAIRAAYSNLPVYIAKEEQVALTSAEENLSAMLGTPLAPNITDAGDLPINTQMSLDGSTWKVLDTSGHSPGGRSFYCAAARIVIVGDAIFQMSIGRVDFHHSNEQRLLRNIRENLFTLPSDTKILPGHGPNTTVGEESLYNPFLQM